MYEVYVLQPVQQAPPTPPPPASLRSLPPPSLCHASVCFNRRLHAAGRFRFLYKLFAFWCSISPTGLGSKIPGESWGEPPPLVYTPFRFCGPRWQWRTSPVPATGRKEGSIDDRRLTGQARQNEWWKTESKGRRGWKKTAQRLLQT